MDDVKVFDPKGPIYPGISLIEASAGTGKTYAISSIFIRLIGDNIASIDEILVVTFTQAATAELRDRLRKRLHNVLDDITAFGSPPKAPVKDEISLYYLAQPDNLNLVANRLQAAIHRFDEAAISTIHGFCRRSLQTNAFESGVEFDLEMVEDASDIIEEIVGDFYATETEGMEEWLISALRSRKLLEKMKELASHTGEDIDIEVLPPPPGAKKPDPKTWLEAFDLLASKWKACREEVQSLLFQAIEGGCLHGSVYNTSKLPNWEAEIQTWLDRGPRPGCLSPTVLKNYSASYLKEKTKKNKPTPTHPFFDIVEEFRREHEALSKKIAQYELELLHRMVAKVRPETKARKVRERVMSFHDLLVRLRDALRDNSFGNLLAEAVRNRYKAALVDEFQDTDVIQWEVFRRIFADKGRYLFLVGDPKQSIYAFRKADIYAYLKAQKAAHYRFTLTTNWRSDGRLVEAVSCLYKGKASPFAIENISFVDVSVPPEHKEDRLLFRDGPRPPLVFRHIINLEGGYWDKGKFADLIYADTAAEISKLLNERPFLVTENRELRPRDIAVLVRKNQQAEEVQRALKRVGINAVIYGAKSVFATETARELGLLMRALLVPRDLKAVKTALGSWLLGRTPGAVLAMTDEEFNEELERIRKASEAWARDGVVAGFSCLFDIEEKVGASGDGERRLTDLRHLLEILQEKEREDHLGPQALFDWFMEAIEKSGKSDESLQVRIESDEDAVQVVTMHRAKGLQYPVVFCPFLWDGYLLPNKRRTYRVHKDKDGEVEVVLYLKDYCGNDEGVEGLARFEAFAESLRIAYVGLTRAMHRCVVHCGVVNEMGQSPLGWLLFGQEEDPKEWLSTKRRLHETISDSDLLSTLEDLVSRSKGAIGVETCDPAQIAPLPYKPLSRPKGDLCAKHLPMQSIPTPWLRTGYTGLIHSFHVEDPEVDRDPGRLVQAQDYRVLLPNFPRGPEAGSCLHEIFEKVLKGEGESPEIVSKMLMKYGFEASLTTEVLEAVETVLEQPLSEKDPDLRLSAIHPSDLSCEMPFIMTVAGGRRALGRGVEGKDLARILREEGGDVTSRYADTLEGLDLPTICGFLAGRIDLFFRYKGRFYLVDFKSNDLGPDPQDYEKERLLEEMIRSHYVLQYLIYAAALDRHLARSYAGYDPSQDFGGVFYLFVRGASREGPKTGVFFDRPSPRLLERLSEVLR